MGLTTQERERREARRRAEVEPKVAPRHMGQLKRIELPDVQELSELFAEMRVADLDPAGIRREPGELFCSARPLASWYVVPTPLLDSALKDMSKELGISLRIVMRDSGTALITANYDRILGGRWIAVVDGAKVRTAARRVR